MRNASILVQITLFIIAIVAIWLYVYPSFMDISDRQDRISEYGRAIDEATQVNQLLAGLVQDINAVSTAEQERLSTYLPETIDPVVVQRDLLAYAQRHPLQLVSLNQSDDTRVYEDSNIQTASFTVVVVGQYEDIKNMLTDIESNNYALHIESLDIQQASGSTLQASARFITYAFFPTINN